MLRFDRFHWPSRGATLALLFALLVAVLVPSAGAALTTDQPIPTPTISSLSETTPSAAMPSIPDRSSVMPYSLSQPFPSTDTLTTTIEGIATSLRGLPQPLTPPADALSAADLLGEVPGPLPGLSVQSVHRLFLPTLTKSAGATPPPPPPSASPADVSLTLWVTPSIRVAGDGTLVYELRVTNYGKGTAKGVQITLPYNRQQVTLTNASFLTGSGDWVSAVGDSTITVSFGPIAPGAKRIGYLYQRVARTLPNDTVISVRAATTWSDSREGGSGASNWTPVLVGSGSTTSAYLWLAVSPASGKAGTNHRFYTDRFIPGEGVTTWLNTPSGVKPLDLRATADGYGRIWLDFASTGLTPGSYSLVAQGARSGLTAVSGFVVQP